MEKKALEFPYFIKHYAFLWKAEKYSGLIPALGSWSRSSRNFVILL
jgi:hypothetical protein